MLDSPRYAFVPNDIARAAARVRERASVVRERASGRIGLAVGELTVAEDVARSPVGLPVLARRARDVGFGTHFVRIRVCVPSAYARAAAAAGRPGARHRGPAGVLGRGTTLGWVLSECRVLDGRRAEDVPQLGAHPDTGIRALTDNALRRVCSRNLAALTRHRRAAGARQLAGSVDCTARHAFAATDVVNAGTSAWHENCPSAAMPVAALSLAALLQAWDRLQRPTPEYTPRRPEDTLLHRVVRTHLATFLERAAELDESGVPRFVEKELRGYLRCGVLAHGFCRIQCGGCSYERLVPLSCKGRGICPSCGGKRMTELAQHLTEQVIPHVPVRQFVLSLPHRLRYWLAYDHARSLGILRVVLRAVFDFYRRGPLHAAASDRRTGSVTFLQRFGSAGNLNLHFHIVVLDGVFTEAPDHSLRFHPAPAPTDEAIARLLATIRGRILRHLARWMQSEESTGAADRLTSEAPLLAACYASSIGQRRTVGTRAGAPLERIGSDRDAPRVERRGRLQAHLDGFDLHAALRVAAQYPEGRAPLEKLLKYCARPRSHTTG